MWGKIGSLIKNIPNEWAELTDEEKAFTKGIAAGIGIMFLLVVGRKRPNQPED